MSTKTTQKPYNGSKSCQKHVRKSEQRSAESLDVDGLKINLGHLVGSPSKGKKVETYEQIATQLSSLAGRTNGDSWTWRYVASFHSGTIKPSEKFLIALGVLLEKSNPRRKQWFYFVRRRSVAAVYDKCILAEMIIAQMRGLKFRAVTFSRYMEVKCAATHHKKLQGLR